MQPGPVVEDFDVLKDSCSGGLPIFERAAVVYFQLQVRKEALDQCIVVRHAGPAHAQSDFRFRRFCPVVQASVLAALVVMKGQAWPRVALQQRHIQRETGVRVLGFPTFSRA